MSIGGHGPSEAADSAEVRQQGKPLRWWPLIFAVLFFAAFVAAMLLRDKW